MEDNRQDAAGQLTGHRVSVQEAAERLGTTVDAIRKRVQRDTIAYNKDPEGRVWILLDADRTKHDADQDATGQRQDALLEAKDEVIEGLRDRVAFLERELDRRGDETARLHQIVGGLTQANAHLAARIPELEASQEAPGDAETVDEAPQTAEPWPDAPGPQAGARPPQGGRLRGLRRRILGW